MKNVRLKPEAVPVTGVGKIFNKIKTLYTEKVHLDHLESSGNITVGLAISPASLKISNSFRGKIEISYIIGKR
jgi:hypothetical protein